MLSIGQLTEKTDAIQDSDLMLIEDVEDTKRVTVEKLSEYLQKNSDRKIEDVKEVIMNQYKQDLEKITENYKNVAEAYYDLSRNYVYLNSAFESMKEKMLQIKQDSDPLSVTYDETTETINITR